MLLRAYPRFGRVLEDDAVHVEPRGEYGTQGYCPERLEDCEAKMIAVGERNWDGLRDISTRIG